MHGRVNLADDVVVALCAFGFNVHTASKYRCKEKNKYFYFFIFIQKINH